VLPLGEQIANVFAGGRPLGETREMVNRRSPASAMPAAPARGPGEA
jgi:hypothetical protein